MDVVDDEIVKKILTADHPDAKIIIKKWYMNDDIIEAGNNYSSAIYRLTVEYLQNNDPLEIRIFIKVPSANTTTYEIGKKMKAFDKELIMYTDILPRMFAMAGKRFYPRCYMEGENHTLFLKDLSQSGYKMANRHEQLDFEHCYHVLKCLARFHGLSVRLRGTEGLPRVVEEEAFLDGEKFDENLRDSLFSGLRKFYDNLDPLIQEKYSDQIKIFKEVSWEEIVEDCALTGDSFRVLNHGDFWTNNMIFKYDRFGMIKKVKLLDFQICRWNSPVMDLIYFTVTSMRYEVYEKYFDLLLNIYLDTLNKVLGSLDCGMYPMKDLRSDMGKRYRFALMTLTCILPILVSDAGNPIDMSELAKDSDMGRGAMNEACRQTRYMQIATKWFINFAEKDIFGFRVKTVENVCTIQNRTETGVRNE